MNDTILESVINDLVTANLILFNEGVLDAFGHVSVRNPHNRDHFFLARNMAPGLVTKEDILEFNLEGETVNNDPRKVYLERYIHSEIYRKRDDVEAIVHSHSHSVVPFSVVKSASLKPMCHMSGFMGTSVPIFEIRDVAGDETNMLITSQELGSSLTQSLGENTLVLMRGHGSTVVAPSLKQAVYRAIYVEVNAQLQIEASRLGPVEFLSEGEAHATQITNEGQVDRPWNLWKTRAIKAQKSWLPEV
ncbi:class II aldolase/adducin family protein [Marinomonas sp. M1K-6]|mgnify:FL=1|uniref:Class II aldolase/adducin family protein n=2 Tax=Marinomonas TaxID=28253 RepID=A0A847R418_9GAMM|nr:MULTISPECIES: class II aldolase/adducin family protein [Marinomonas]NLQ18711.1 class II aldolase/adducin family protein [Marinomonas profundi]RCW93179.1 HCOMODA/2-hydroxy-3-carboxy-muconic semialdehyde decarboxylase [Marinomonas foliarum]UDV04043.1 class II aldolase/adducin family protein [Marinomonas profundi]|tara:strand:+ start:357 stop:1097 length:741 start_codon:yes stop_codon:yes gene_type:complete